MSTVLLLAQVYKDVGYDKKELFQLDASHKRSGSLYNYLPALRPFYRYLDLSNKYFTFSFCEALGTVC